MIENYQLSVSCKESIALSNKHFIHAQSCTTIQIAKSNNNGSSLLHVQSMPVAREAVCFNRLNQINAHKIATPSGMIAEMVPVRSGVYSLAWFTQILLKPVGSSNLGSIE